MDKQATPVLIAFGANLNPLFHLKKGLTLLHQRIGLQAISTVYRTAPLGDIPQLDYLNGAVLSHCQLPITLLKPILQEIEEQCGRVRGDHPYAPRTLDLDIAMMGGAIHTSPHLPDPDILQRPFLLRSLAELAPNLSHPQMGHSLARLAATLHQDTPPLTKDAEATHCLQHILFLRV